MNLRNSSHNVRTPNESPPIRQLTPSHHFYGSGADELLKIGIDFMQDLADWRLFGQEWLFMQSPERSFSKLTSYGGGE
jgi:hypothetical protein